jgi:hypothetical protein
MGVRAVFVASVIACACGAPGRGAAQTIPLIMNGAPGDARVTVDDQIVGTLDMVHARSVALPFGSHRVSVEAPGYFPFDTIVEAKDGEKSVVLDTKLTRVPD